MGFDTLGMELITKVRHWESDLGQNLGWKLGFEPLEYISLRVMFNSNGVLIFGIWYRPS